MNRTLIKNTRTKFNEKSIKLRVPAQSKHNEYKKSDKKLNNPENQLNHINNCIYIFVDENRRQTYCLNK